MIVFQHRFVIIIGGGTELHVGSLVSKGRFSEHADKPAHRIASVECALRTSHHVDAFNIGVIEVESGFVDERDVIDTDPICPLRMSACENELDESACWRRRVFSFGVAIITTSSMSITFTVSRGAIGPDANPDAAVASARVVKINLVFIYSFCVMLLRFTTDYTD